MRMNEADREVHDFRCKLSANAKSSMLQDNSPDAACMYEHACTEYIERTERKSSVVSFRHRNKRQIFALHTGSAV